MVWGEKIGKDVVGSKTFYLFYRGLMNVGKDMCDKDVFLRI